MLSPSISFRFLMFRLCLVDVSHLFELNRSRCAQMEMEERYEIFLKRQKETRTQLGGVERSEKWNSGARLEQQKAQSPTRGSVPKFHNHQVNHAVPTTAQDVRIWFRPEALLLTLSPLFRCSTVDKITYQIAGTAFHRANYCNVMKFKLAIWTNLVACLFAVFFLGPVVSFFSPSSTLFRKFVFLFLVPMLARLLY